MSRRFYSLAPIDSGQVRLEDSEAHHLIHVMRAKVGDEVILFDGSGSEFDVRVAAVSRNNIDLSVIARRDVRRELPAPLTMAVALPRGDRQDWLTQKLVELGVARLIPWQTSRSVALPRDKTIRRLRRNVIEASKQCGRNELMKISDPVDFATVIAQRTNEFGILADRDESALPISRIIEPSAVQDTIVGIGPEGGFSAEERRQAAESGWRTASLGARILRTETAAIAIASWLMLQWQSQPPVDQSQTK